MRLRLRVRGTVVSRRRAHPRPIALARLRLRSLSRSAGASPATMHQVLESPRTGTALSLVVWGVDELTDCILLLTRYTNSFTLTVRKRNADFCCSPDHLFHRRTSHPHRLHRTPDPQNGSP